MKRIKPIIYLLLSLLCIHLILNFTKSNAEYVADAQEEYNEILKPGIDKNTIKRYLNEKGADYIDRKKENCVPFRDGDFKYECNYTGAIHTSMTIGSVFNPVSSSANIYLFFDKDGTLLTYEITIGHSFI